MQRIFWLSLVIALMLLGIGVSAQKPDNSSSAYVNPHPGSYSTPVDRAAYEAGLERIRKSEELKNEAKDLLQQGNISKAIPLLEQRLPLFANDEDRILLADLYSRQGKPDEVIRVMHSVIYPDPHIVTYASKDPSARMLYVLALIDKGKWEEAVAVYEPTIHSNPRWQLPGGGSQHTFPSVHFDSHVADSTAMRAQAHLIIGASLSLCIETEENQLPYMLDHLKQSLKYNAESPDAHFLSGLLLTKLNRFHQARKEFNSAAKYASDTAQPEIGAALKDLQVQEAQKRAKDAIKAVQQAAAAKQTPQPTDH